MTSRTHARTRKHRKPDSAHGGRAPRRQRTDIRVYILFVMVGLFAVPLMTIVTNWRWTWVAVGYVAAMAVLVNFYAWKALFTADLPEWQKALARLPLRFVGYGAETGKPLSAARHDPRARTALVVCFLVCTSIIAGLGWFVLAQ